MNLEKIDKQIFKNKKINKGNDIYLGRLDTIV